MGAVRKYLGAPEPARPAVPVFAIQSDVLEAAGVVVDAADAHARVAVGGGDHLHHEALSLVSGAEPAHDALVGIGEVLADAMLHPGGRALSRADEERGVAAWSDARVHDSSGRAVHLLDYIPGPSHDRSSLVLIHHFVYLANERGG